MKTSLLSRTFGNFFALLALSVTFQAATATAQISISAGSSVSENFSTIGTSATATLPTGWRVDKNTTSRLVGSYASAVTATDRAGGANLTSSAGNGIYNFGSSATDRAIGGLSSASASKSVNLYVALQNTGGAAIPNFTLSYNAERYRNGSNPVGFSIELYYSTDGVNWTSAGASFISSFAPNADNNGAAVVPIETLAVTSQTLPVALSAGSTLYLAWNYSVTSGTTTSNSQAIGVSDISITAADVVPGAPVITSPVIASAVAFETSSSIYQITATENPTSYGASGLPQGLTLDAVTGVISGQPTVSPGSYPVVITATNAFGTGQENLSLTITKNPGSPTITSSLAVTIPLGSPVSYQIEASNSPTSYAASNLPTGLAIDTATGLISGTPTTSGVRNISITASNSLGSDTQTLVLTVTSLPAITSTLSGSLYTTDSFSYTITATGTPTPTFDATGLPSGWTITNGVISNNGTPLTTGTVSFQISASNSVGTDTETYTLAVFDQAAQNAIPLNVVVNKYVNATPDKVQLLVIGNGTAGSTVDMRGMIIKDFSDSNVQDNGGKYVFADNPLWSVVPAGTLIALSATDAGGEDIDPSDFTLAVNLGNTAYFIEAGGSFNIGTTDMVLIKAAGSGASGVAGGIHALATAGTTPGAQFAAFLGAKLRTAQTSGTNAGLIANNTTSTLVDYGVSGSNASTDATGAIAATAMDFVSWNNETNQIYIQGLRGSPPPNPYNSWASGFGLDPTVTTGPTAGAPTADPDGDSFNNAQEYAFGTNPTQGTSSLLNTEVSGGDLIVQWLQRGDVTYTPQSTANLATTPFADDFSVTVVNGPVQPAPPAGYIRRQFTVPASGQKFYRVSAITSP